ncbi:MAG: hypothetical protein KJN71_05295 [Acidimicrobiia bacterium]|nr:hypothetical protein [Acidimicrobiia bacterium]NNC74457.1 hypothetical protein [Acidimicrobiia bacterium]
MSREDPKPGRWLLPIVVVALIGFTAVFVQQLSPGEVEGGTTTTTTLAAGGTTTTTTAATTTTTSIPAATQAFITAADGYSGDANTLLADAKEINQQWDDRDVGLSAIRATLEEITISSTTLADTVKATEAPDNATDEWADVETAVDEIATGAAAMQTGLESADTGEARREALVEYEAAVGQFRSALAAAITAARG